MEHENINNLAEITFQNTSGESSNTTPSPQRRKKRSQLSWKTWLIISVSVILLIGGGLFIYDRITNTYKTPLDRYIAVMNSKSFSTYDEIAVLNGFAAPELKLFEMCNRMTEGYLSDQKQDFKETIKNRKEAYGENFRYSYKIEDKEPLGRDGLKDFENQLSDTADALGKIVSAASKFDSKDWDKFADIADLSLLQAKLYIFAMRTLSWELKTAEITDGYELEVAFVIKGSKLDGPEEIEKSMTVCKINGRWVCAEFLEQLVNEATTQWLSSDVLSYFFSFH